MTLYSVFYSFVCVFSRDVVLLLLVISMLVSERGVVVPTGTSGA